MRDPLSLLQLNTNLSYYMSHIVLFVFFVLFVLPSLSCLYCLHNIVTSCFSYLFPFVLGGQHPRVAKCPGVCSVFPAAMKNSTSKTPNIYFYLRILFLVQDESFSTSSSAIFSIVVEFKSMYPIVSLIPGISVLSILTGRIYSLFSRNALACACLSSCRVQSF